MTKSSDLREFHEKHSFPLDKTLREEPDAVSSYNLRKAAKAITKLAEYFELTLVTSVGRGDDRATRAHLILEETAEILHALADKDELELLDGLCDLVYVTLGTAVAYRLPFEEGFDEVHRSNMTKPVGDAKTDPRLRNKDGYEPPKLREILDANARD